MAINTISADYTLAAGDAGTIINMTANNIITITAGDAAFAVGDKVEIRLDGYGIINIVAGGTSTVYPAVTKLMEQGQAVTLTKISATQWSASESLRPIVPPSDDFIASLEAAAMSGDASALVYIQDGQVALEYGKAPGAIYHRGRVNSVRKVFTALLIGNAVGKGLLDLDSTMADYGIRDGAGGSQTPLSAAEQQATLRNLLWSDSGIYHPAAYEPSDMSNNRPARESDPVGTTYWYNNWNFNVAQHIYAAHVQPYYKGIAEVLGEPCGYRDFDAQGNYTSYVPDNSIFPAYVPNMSAHDRAKTAQLILQRGYINGQQVVPRSYMDEMWTPKYNTGGVWSWGYCWNMAAQPDGSVLTSSSASMGYRSGTNGQRVYVFPHRNAAIGVMFSSQFGGTGFSSSDLTALMQNQEIS